jgi:hypothetical protein
METKVKVKMPDLSLDVKGDTRQWLGVATEIQKSMLKRTLAGVSVTGRPFKAYTADYLKKRTAGKVGKPGGGYYGSRPGTVNLSLSSQMLNAMRAVGKRTKGFVVISGNAGFKAWVNELKGRKFFGISKKESAKVTKRVADFISRKNKLKKR